MNKGPQTEESLQAAADGNAALERGIEELRVKYELKAAQEAAAQGSSSPNSQASLINADQLPRSAFSVVTIQTLGASNPTPSGVSGNSSSGADFVLDPDLAGGVFNRVDYVSDD